MRSTFFIILLVPLFVMSCRENRRCEKEIYLIPKNFKGKIIVFFDQKGGMPIQYEDSARIYKIPNSGFLRSQFPANGGCMSDNRIKFFYSDSLGNRTPCEYFLDIDIKKIPTERDYVLFTFLSEKDKKPSFVIHLVGNVSEFQELTKSVRYLEPERILKSLTETEKPNE